jgi:hypothetical protein
MLEKIFNLKYGTTPKSTLLFAPYSRSMFGSLLRRLAGARLNLGFSELWWSLHPVHITGFAYSWTPDIVEYINYNFLVKNLATFGGVGLFLVVDVT